MLSPPIIAVDEVSVGYEPKKPVLNRVTLAHRHRRPHRAARRQRQRQVDAGQAARRTSSRRSRASITRADKLSVGYFAQHQLDELNLDGSPYDHIRRLMPDAPESKVRARVGAIGFSGKAGDTLVKSLSGGEKARLLLGLATFFGPNMIILDEPTNHLDIDSRAALAEAINEFPGAVIMVSHDRYLIEACADRLWVVANRTVTSYDGDLDDYRRMVLSADGVRAASRERDKDERDKPERARARKADTAEADDRAGRSRDRAHQRHHRQDRRRAGAAGSVHARSEAGRAARPRRAPVPKARCSAPRRNGWRPVRCEGG